MSREGGIGRREGNDVRGIEGGNEGACDDEKQMRRLFYTAAEVREE